MKDIPSLKPSYLSPPDLLIHSPSQLSLKGCSRLPSIHYAIGNMFCARGRAAERLGEAEEYQRRGSARLKSCGARGGMRPCGGAPRRRWRRVMWGCGGTGGRERRGCEPVGLGFDSVLIPASPIRSQAGITLSTGGIRESGVREAVDSRES